MESVHFSLWSQFAKVKLPKSYCACVIAKQGTPCNCLIIQVLNSSTQEKYYFYKKFQIFLKLLHGLCELVIPEFCTVCQSMLEHAATFLCYAKLAAGMNKGLVMFERTHKIRIK